MKKPRPSILFLSDKRLGKRLHRKRKLSMRAWLKNYYKRRHRDYESKAINLLATERYRNLKPSPRKRAFVVKIPAVFSLIENPDKSLEPIFELAALARREKPKTIVFDHHRMEQVDLAAESVLDVVAMEFIKELKHRDQRLPELRGLYPRSDELKRLLRAVGIIRNLKVRHEYLPKSKLSPLRVFHKRNSTGIDLETLKLSAKKANVVARFVDHIDSCLKDQSRTLSPVGKQRLSEYTGEIIGNAEDHSGTGDWTIVGYLDNLNPSRICEIAIFNFGYTIADTFEMLPAESMVLKEIEPYVEEHSKKKFFSRKWTRENLLTLVALQGHISSKNLNPGDDRGQGTVDLIEFFQRVHRECVGDGQQKAQMAIISGATHILFDGTHLMKPDKSGRSVIAFNDENDLRQPPDSGYVQNLSRAFPGTIICIKFPMKSAKTLTKEVS